MAISRMTRRRGKEPKIMVAEPLLTVLLAKDSGHYCAKCPELDLVTELPTVDAALEDLIDAIRDYAKEYLQDRDRYATSPNRAHHVPYVEAIAACKTDWEVRTLIEIKHGLVHVERFPCRPQARRVRPSPVGKTRNLAENLTEWVHSASADQPSA